MNQQVTLRIPASLAEQINRARGSEPVAKFILRSVARQLNGEQENEKVIQSIELAKAKILAAINNLTSA